MNQTIVFTGLAIIILGFLLVALGSADSQKTESKFFIGGIIGFIPFGFGNDKRLVFVGLAVTVLVFLLWVINK